MKPFEVFLLIGVAFVLFCLVCAIQEDYLRRCRMYGKEFARKVRIAVIIMMGVVGASAAIGLTRPDDTPDVTRWLVLTIPPDLVLCSITLWTWILYLGFLRKKRALVEPTIIIATGWIVHEPWKKRNRTVSYVGCAVAIALGLEAVISNWTDETSQSITTLGLFMIAATMVATWAWTDRRIATIAGSSGIVLFGTRLLERKDIDRVKIAESGSGSFHHFRVEIETVEGETFQIPFPSEKNEELRAALVEIGFLGSDAESSEREEEERQSLDEV